MWCLHLLRDLEASGVPRPALREAAARRAEDPSVEAAWRTWTDVREREELRVRLHVLGRVRRLEPGLHEFLLFFFRASDPALYQPAAVAIRPHSPTEPALRESVDQ
jgi:hypothetical protein